MSLDILDVNVLVLRPTRCPLTHVAEVIGGNEAPVIVPSPFPPSDDATLRPIDGVDLVRLAVGFLYLSTTPLPRITYRVDHVPVDLGYVHLHLTSTTWAGVGGD